MQETIGKIDAKNTRESFTVCHTAEGAVVAVAL